MWAPSGWARRLSDWACWVVPLLVLLLTLKTTWGVLGTFDVGFDDETIYLEAAHWAGKRFLPLADSSPLYPLWYRLLSFFQPDPVRLYFLNWFVLTASLPLLLYALARRSGGALGTSALVALAWSMSMTVMTWPYVSKFAALLLGLGALAATWIADRRLAVATTSAALCLAAYARAELTLPSFGFAGAVALWTAWSVLRGAAARTDRRRALLAGGIAVATPLALRGIFGDPHQGGRAFFAFGQHYALNVVEDKQLAVDPWTLWDRFVREAFPHATTIGEAFRENPAAMMWHVRRNLSTTPIMLRKLVRPLTFVPSAFVEILPRVVAVIVSVGLLALVLRRKRLDGRLVAWLPLFAVVMLTTAGSVLLIYPREHYLIPPVWLGLAALAAACAGMGCLDWLPERWRSRLPAWRSPSLASQRIGLVVALVAVLFLLPTRRATLPALLAATEPPPPLVHENVQTIATLRSLHLQGHVPILEPDHSRGVYAELDFQRVAQWDKNAPFWKFVHDRNVAVVVLNRRLREDPRFKSDPEFTAFADGTGEREDFDFIPVPNTQVTLAVRRSVLARSK